MIESRRSVAQNMVHGLVSDTLQIGCMNGASQGIRPLGYYTHPRNTRTAGQTGFTGRGYTSTAYATHTQALAPKVVTKNLNGIIPLFCQKIQAPALQHQLYVV